METAEGSLYFPFPARLQFVFCRPCSFPSPRAPRMAVASLNFGFLRLGGRYLRTLDRLDCLALLFCHTFGSLWLALSSPTPSSESHQSPPRSAKNLRKLVPPEKWRAQLPHTCGKYVRLVLCHCPSRLQSEPVICTSLSRSQSRLKLWSVPTDSGEL